MDHQIYAVNDGCAWKWGARGMGFVYGLYTLFCWVECLSQIIVNFVFFALGWNIKDMTNDGYVDKWTINETCFMYESNI